MEQAVDREQLLGANKILFITHLAIGDYCYLQSCFRAFKQCYPHIEIHLWVEEVRRTSDSSEWPSLANYALYDWVEESGLFTTLYRETYSPSLFESSIERAREEAYPIVVSLAEIRPHYFAQLARQIAPEGWVVGTYHPPAFYEINKKRSYHALDAVLEKYPAPRDRGQYHISQVYSYWFEQLGVSRLSEEERYPYIDIPQKWLDSVAEELQLQGATRPLLFLNPFAKNRKRSWPLSELKELIVGLQQESEPLFKRGYYIVNAPPSQWERLSQWIEQEQLQRVIPFTAGESFFQLPAILALSDLVISVETSTMHLANAVQTPVIALMRQKTPHWYPLNQKLSEVIFTQKRHHHLKAIRASSLLERIRGSKIVAYLIEKQRREG